ncbi:MAG: TonB family protein [Acidobacteria bacterium]|nr:TonB family protein [Acidobacteriota bacterium]
MFHNLIESGSHRKELKRRGRFLLGTLATYALLVTLAGVASVTAYTANLGSQNFEVTMLPPWTLPQPAARPQPADSHPAPHGGARNELPERTDAYTDLHTVTNSPPPISTQQTHVIPMPRGEFILGDRNSAPVGGGVNDLGNNPVGRATAPVVVGVPANEVEDLPPPRQRATPQPTPQKPLALSTIIASKVISKPVPPYPPIAKATHTQGTVTVEILVDEQGRVVSATATAGPAMLREAARQAALEARFTPTRLNGEPVKVSGVISYNFVLQ